MNKFINFAAPDIGQEEIVNVISCLQSGWVTSGPMCERFEKDFNEFLGGGLYAIAVNSATAGLHLALEALGIGPGDEVITTTHTFTATAEVIRYLGANPVFVDIDPLTLCIDPKLIERRITGRTKAILPVHFAGRAADMTSILYLANKYGLRVVEDAAHALPATHKGKIIGALGSDATVFSFYANKTITTGEGGMLVTRDTKIADRARIMRLHGINRNTFDRFTSTKPKWFYEVVAPGYKYNMTDIAAAIGVAQLKKARGFQERRAEIAHIYTSELSSLPLDLPPQPDFGDVHSWHLYVVQIQETVRLARSDFIDMMFEQGIGCSVHYLPLHNQPYWKNEYSLSPDLFPQSESVSSRSISLPIHTLMTAEDISRVICAVRKILS